MNPIFVLSLWAPVVAWAGLIFFLSAIPSLNSGLGAWDIVFRKIVHVVEYAVLFLLLFRAFRRTWAQWGWHRVGGYSGVLSIVYAMSDEFHQSFVPGRGPSVLDVLIDAVGVALALIVCKNMKRMNKYISIGLLLLVACGPNH
jgi:VanZ family protein